MNADPDPDSRADAPVSPQLVIMNASSCLGRIFPGFVAHKLGVGNMILGACFVCSVMIFGMIGLGSVASVVIIGIIYGFFSGICECIRYYCTSR